jgi:cytochrome d ubiquinol oxidase subunit I
MLNDAWFQQALHTWIAAYTATAFGVAGVYAWGLLRGRRDAYHVSAVKIAVGLGLIVSVLQAISGDISAKWVAENQPVKFAAMEGHFETESRVPLIIGGWPNPETRETKWAIEIPGGLSWLAHGDFDAEVTGLNEFPMGDQPEPRVVHLGFQIMVGLGATMILTSAMIWVLAWRRNRFAPGPWQSRALVALAPAGFIAIEAGWVVTEVGRQPWIIQGVMRTEDAVTQVPNQFVALGGFTALYALLAVACTWLLLLLAKHPPKIEELTHEKEAAHAVE